MWQIYTGTGKLPYPYPYEFILENFFYATWTCYACSFRNILRFYGKQKIKWNILDPALVVLLVRSGYWVPSSSIVILDKISCNFFTDFFLKIFFYATWPYNECSLQHTLKFCDKPKIKINNSDPALVILCVRDGYWVPISNILTLDKISCNFFTEFFLKKFFYATCPYIACSFQPTLKSCRTI